MTPRPASGLLIMKARSSRAGHRGIANGESRQGRAARHSSLAGADRRRGAGRSGASGQRVEQRAELDRAIHNHRPDLHRDDRIERRHGLCRDAAGGERRGRADHELRDRQLHLLGLAAVGPLLHPDGRPLRHRGGRQPPAVDHRLFLQRRQPGHGGPGQPARDGGPHRRLFRQPALHGPGHRPERHCGAAAGRRRARLRQGL